MVRRVTVEMQVLFDIKENEIGNAVREDPKGVLKEVLNMVRTRVSSFKDKIAILNDKSTHMETQLKELNSSVLSQIESKVNEAVQLEREESNRNAQTVIESLRQASNDL